MPVVGDAELSDASRICDPTGTFDAPVPLTALNTAGVESSPRLTADELELYFGGTPYMMSGGIYRAQRSTVSQPFSSPVVLTELNALDGANPSVSSDGLVLFFNPPRIFPQGYHIYVSTRTSRVGEFSSPFEVANVNSVAVTDNDVDPFVTADGQELWFESDRAGGLGGDDIYRAVWNGSEFANVTAITSLNSITQDWYPVLSSDKLTVYFSSYRDGQGDFDIFTSHRSTTSDEFPAPNLVPELNSSAADVAGWLSPDNCRLYFDSTRAGTDDLYIATRHPL